MDIIWIKWEWNQWMWFFLQSECSNIFTEKKREKHIFTEYSVSGWMLCVIPHICKDVFDNSYGNHMKKVKNFIKICFMVYQMKRLTSL